MTSRRRATSNQRSNNVMYVNVGTYNFEQRLEEDILQTRLEDVLENVLNTS